MKVFRSLKIIAFMFWFVSDCFCQVKNDYTKLFDFVPDKALILNLNTDFSKFTYSDYVNYVDKLFASDQYYRIQLEELRKNGKDSPEIRNSMSKNDRNNLKILLILVKKFGWPCNQNINKSYYVWIILWHMKNIDNLILPFRPYFETAFKNKCFDSEFYYNLKPFFEK